MVHKARVAFATPRQRLQDWLSYPPGSMLLEAEITLLGDSLTSLFGYHLLQVGQLGNADLLTRSRISHRVVVDVDKGRNVSDYPCLWAEPDTLPIASDSIDAIIFPHVLEFFPRVQETIKEAKRVLVAEGHLVVLAFNPWSLTGIWHLLFGGERKETWIPCQGGRFLGFGQVRDWITGQGFEVISSKRYFFRPPASIGGMNRGGASDPLRFLDTIGPRFWPFLSGAYLLVAKKRVLTLTSRKPSWRQPRRLIAVGLGEPSS
uniref:Ubiquinone/menaquinone biosynthesis C-methylase UbiE n=1 Tax=Candidatus Kentrum sp. MB TaxID=2138164 RepID=A0A450X410_9GAMM|nr:MAG: Ubiquinone/menaquinone biosynthesis C-methylase UbiE [Candidatus Kentron sp. MB]